MDPDNVKQEVTWTTFMGEMVNLDFDRPGPMRQDSYEEDGFIFQPIEGLFGGEGGGGKKNVGPSNGKKVGKNVGDIVMNSGGDPKKILVFDNDDFVDSSGGEIGEAESDEIQASLEAYGHHVMTFTSLNAHELEELLEGKDVLVIPELENVTGIGELQDLVFELGEVIRDFVQNGGKLIVNGSGDNGGGSGIQANVLFLNAVFGYELFTGSTDLESELTDEALNTFFRNAPESIGDNDGGESIVNLPDNALSIYESESGRVDRCVV